MFRVGLVSFCPLLRLPPSFMPWLPDPLISFYTCLVTLNSKTWELSHRCFCAFAFAVSSAKSAFSCLLAGRVLLQGLVHSLLYDPPLPPSPCFSSCYVNEPKMATVYWLLGFYFFTAGWDPLAKNPIDTKLKFLHIQLFQKNSSNEQIFSYLGLACFAYPAKLHQAYVSHW